MLTDNTLPYPWLKAALEPLEQAWNSGRFHHALLLKGSRGSGKWAFANHLGSALLCNNGGALYPCQVCKSCLLVKSGNHPDLCVIDNGEQTIGIDEIRRVGDFVQTKSHIGTNRVILINHVEQMTEAAANALLKTLEEPAGHVYLILASDMPERLLATILSRCSQLTIGVSDKAEAIEYVQSYFGELNQGQIEWLLRLSGNGPLQVVSWLEQYSPQVIVDIENQYARWRFGEITSVAVAAVLENNHFAYLLFIHLLHDELTALACQAQSSTPQADVFALLVSVGELLGRHSEQQHQVKGQNQRLSLLKLLAGIQQLLGTRNQNPAV